MHVTDYAKTATQSFALPDMCMRIRNMLDDGNSAIEDIGDVVSLDPSITSKLLKLANSPLFRFRSQVDTIAKALNIIGGEALYNLVMAETARSAFSHFANEDADLKRFWLQSIYCGIVAKHLAKMAKIRGSERFFVLGLLHNFAELVVASESPEKVNQCLDYDKESLPWKRQRAVLGFTFAQCSGEIMKLWQLPSQLYYPVECLHDEEKALSNKDVGIMHTSARVALALTHDNIYQVNELVDPVVLKSLGIDAESLEDAINFTLIESSKILAIMNPRLK